MNNPSPRLLIMRLLTVADNHIPPARVRGDALNALLATHQASSSSVMTSISGGISSSSPYSSAVAM